MDFNGPLFTYCILNLLLSDWFDWQLFCCFSFMLHAYMGKWVQSNLVWAQINKPSVNWPVCWTVSIKLKYLWWVVFKVWWLPKRGAIGSICLSKQAPLILFKSNALPLWRTDSLVMEGSVRSRFSWESNLLILGTCRVCVKCYLELLWTIQ